MNDNTNSCKGKTFKPLVLFHNDINNDNEYLINQYKLKIMEMLNNNLQIWQNESGYYHTDEPPSPSSSSSQKKELKKESTPIKNEIPLKNNKKEQPLKILETKFKTNTKIEQATRNNTTPTTSTMTFISEPQFHHIYKPEIINRKRKRENLPKKVTEFLRDWLIRHKSHPYPTDREKQKLADETGLMVSQVSNWFINARRRILQPLLESEHSTLNTTSSSASSSTVVNIDHNHQYHDLTTEIDTDNSEIQRKIAQPPHWVPLPEKLPSMNILEKDLDAFEPEQ